MQNRLSADIATVHIKVIFVVYLEYYLGGWFWQKWDTYFDHRAMVCFVKRSEGDLVHMENVCLISS